MSSTALGKATERQADFALWGLVLSGVALIGLFGTLIYTAKAAEEARRSAEAAHDANRPWIEVVITEKRAFSIKPQLARVEFMVSLKNRGNSPGTSVRARAVLVAVPEDQSKPLAAITRMEELMDKLDRMHPNRGTTIFPGVEIEPQLAGANLFRKAMDQAAGRPGNKVRFWVAVGVSYKFGDRRCRTLHGYLLKFPGRPETFATSETIELKAHEFTVSSMAQGYAT